MSTRRTSSRLSRLNTRINVTEDLSSDEYDYNFVDRIGKDKIGSRPGSTKHKILNWDNSREIRVKVEAPEEFEDATGNEEVKVKVETLEESSTINDTIFSKKKDRRKATKIKSALELRTCPHPDCRIILDKPSLMKRHYQSKHAREPAAYCDVCGKGFFRVDSIPVHIRAHHPNAKTNIKPKTKRKTPKVEVKTRDSDSDASSSSVSLDKPPIKPHNLRTQLKKSPHSKRTTGETKEGSTCKRIKTPNAKRRDPLNGHHSDSSLSLDNFSDDEHAEKYEETILKKLKSADNKIPISLAKISKNLIEEEGRNFWKPVVEQKSNLEDRTCPVCGKQFTKPSRMKRHFVVHRDLTLKKKSKPQRTVRIV